MDIWTLALLVGAACFVGLILLEFKFRSISRRAGRYASEASIRWRRRRGL